jgi:hypothetical protein
MGWGRKEQGGQNRNDPVEPPGPPHGSEFNPD